MTTETDNGFAPDEMLLAEARKLIQTLDPCHRSATERMEQLMDELDAAVTLSSGALAERSAEWREKAQMIQYQLRALVHSFRGSVKK